jgi:trigger factor
VGSGTVLTELDEQLRGSKVGDILAFDAEIPGEDPVNLRVLVKESKEKKLPEVTDEWASEASEFDTVDELRADVEKRIGLVKRVQSTLALRNSAIDALVELVDMDPPASLIDAEVERRVRDLNQRLEGQGATIAEYLQASGQTPEQFVNSLREGAVPAVKADLGLRAVAEGESLEPTDQDIDDEIERLAASYKVKSKDLRRSLERADQMPAVRSDWKKSKALEWLVEHVEIVDADGQPIDRALLEPDLSTPDPDSPDPDSPETDTSETDSQDPQTGEP